MKAHEDRQLQQLRKRCAASSGKGRKERGDRKGSLCFGKYSKISSEKYLSETGGKEQKPGDQSDHGISYTIKLKMTAIQVFMLDCGFA